MVVHNVNTWVQEQKYVQPAMANEKGNAREKGGWPLFYKYSVLNEQKSKEIAYSWLPKISQSIAPVVPLASFDGFFYIKEISDQFYELKKPCLYLNHSDKRDEFLKEKLKSVKSCCRFFSQAEWIDLKGYVKMSRKSCQLPYLHVPRCKCMEYLLSWSQRKKILRLRERSHCLKKTESLSCLAQAPDRMSKNFSIIQPCEWKEIHDILASNILNYEKLKSRSQPELFNTVKVVELIGAGSVYEGFGLGPQRLNEFGKPEVGFLALGFDEGDTINLTLKGRIRPPCLS